MANWNRSTLSNEVGELRCQLTRYSQNRLLIRDFSIEISLHLLLAIALPDCTRSKAFKPPDKTPSITVMIPQDFSLGSFQVTAGAGI